MSTPLMLAESLWVSYKGLIDAGAINEIRMPSAMLPQLGMEGLSFIGERFSQTLQTTVKILSDPHRNIIRIMAARNLHGPLEVEKPVGSGPKSARKEKTPRPPNAFILYRQRHHPIFKEACPHLHNNEISVILGKQWTEESNDVKDQYKKAAEEIKDQHLRDHPEYQYRPRKPTEKKRRMTKRKAAAIAEQAAKENGEKKDLVNNASSSFNPEELGLDSHLTHKSDVPLGSVMHNAEALSSHVVAELQGYPNPAPLEMEYTSEANTVLTLGDDTALPLDFALSTDAFNTSAVTPQLPTVNTSASLGPVLFDNPTEKGQDEYNFYINAEDPSSFPKVADSFDCESAHAAFDNLIGIMPSNDIFGEDHFVMSEAETHRILNACSENIEYSEMFSEQEMGSSAMLS